MSASSRDVPPCGGITMNNNAPPPAREQVLGNLHLLLNIFSEFLPGDDDDSDELEHVRKDLLKVALVNGLFCEAALDCLWRQIDSLIPVIGLLSFVCLSGDKYVPVSHVTPDGCGDVLKKYAGRVREIRISAPKGNATSVDPSIYVLLAEHLKGEPLLPGLQSIKVSCDYECKQHSWLSFPLLVSSQCLSSIQIKGDAFSGDKVSSSLLPLLSSRLGSSLKRLVLTNEAITLTPTLWSAIVTVFKDLEQLHLRLPRNTNMPEKFLQEELGELRQLSELILDIPIPESVISSKVPPPAPPAPVAVVKKPRERKKKKGGKRRNRLAPKLPQSDPEPALKRPRVRRLYPNLQSFTFVNHANTSLTQSFIIIPDLMECLTSYTFTLKAGNQPHTISDLLDVLSQCQSLKRIQVKGQASTGYQWSGDETKYGMVMVEDVVQILQQLTKLEELVLDVRCLCSAGDSDPALWLERIFSAAYDPRLDGEPQPVGLRSLVLPIEYLDCRAPGLTVLAVVAAHAKNLERLTLSISSSAGPNLSSLSTSGLPGPEDAPNLKYLELRDQRATSIGSPVANVAEYLDACFPRLLSMKGGLPPGHGEHWALVEQHRLLLKRVRMLEAKLFC